MGYNRKLLVAGLAAGVSAYMLYRASKKKQQESTASSSSSYPQQPQEHTPADYHRWGATAPFLATAAVGAVGGAGIASLFNSSSSSSHHAQIQQQQAPAYAPSDLPFSALTDPTYLTSILTACVQDQCLHAYYTFPTLQQIASSIASSGALVQAAESWRLPPALAIDLCKLALFDVCFLLDDSASMHSEGTRRRDALASILRRAADAAGRFDNDGMEARWMNADLLHQYEAYGQIRTAQDADRLTSACRYDGKRTPLGESLEQKILRPLVLDKIMSRTNNKPVLVIVITDGRPTGAGEQNHKLKRVIKDTRNTLERLANQGYRCDADSISYMFAAVGNDREAQDFLDEIDSCDEVGEYVDVCSDFPREQAQIQRATGIDFTEELYCLKILLGGIDSQFDASDESSNVSPWKMRKRNEHKEKMRNKYWSQREELRYQVKQLLERPHAHQQQQPYSYDIGMGSKEVSGVYPSQSNGAAYPQAQPPYTGAMGGQAAQGFPSAPSSSFPSYPPPTPAKDAVYPPALPPSGSPYPPQYPSSYPEQAQSGFPSAPGTSNFYPPPAPQQGYPPYGDSNSPYPPGPSGQSGAYPPPAFGGGGGYGSQPPYGYPASGNAPYPPQQPDAGAFGGGFAMPSASPYPATGQQQGPYLP